MSVRGAAWRNRNLEAASPSARSLYRILSSIRGSTHDRAHTLKGTCITITMAASRQRRILISAKPVPLQASLLLLSRAVMMDPSHHGWCRSA
jgi:hypothetical protein